MPSNANASDACRQNDPRQEECNASMPAAHNFVPKPEHTLGAAQHTKGLTFMFKGLFGGNRCTVLFDTGASTSFVDGAWLQKAQEKNGNSMLSVQPLTHSMGVKVANDEQVAVHKECSGTMLMQRNREGCQIVFPKRLKQRGAQLKLSAKVLPNMLKGIDVIVGMDSLKDLGAKFDCASGKLELHGPSPETPAEKQPKGKAKHDVLCSVYKLQEAAKAGFLSPQQAARQIRAGSSSWLLLVQPEDMETLGLMAAGASDAKPEDTPGLVKREEIEKIKAEYKDVFAPITECPPKRADIDHTIKLVDGATPTFKRPYRMTREEELEVMKQIDDALKKGLIEPSVSPFGAPVLFVQKKDGTLRMCVDYRALNKITVRDRYPLPRIDDLLDKLHGCTVFSSLDLQSGYHQIRISDEDKPKTAMVTPFGQFQFKVLCFGLTNAPATFQRVMNKIFKDQIGKFVLVYLDDILVMSRTPEEHEQHLRIVLEVLRQEGLRAKLSKCEFNKPELHFLGHVIGKDGIAVDPAKIAVIEKWPVPKSLKELQAFLGLANYFRKFVEHFSTVVAPLTSLTGQPGKGQKKFAKAINWSDLGNQVYEYTEKKPDGTTVTHKTTALDAFNEIKRRLVTAPVLAIPDLNKPFQVHTDASVVGTGGVLMQEGRVVAYTSSKFTPAEYNYTTGEQELLGLIRALQVWRCYLEGAPNCELITDHHPLVHLEKQPNLSRRQARWMEFLSRFPFVIMYARGTTNVADPVSRNPLLYDAATPNSIICVGALGVVCAVMTRGRARLMDAGRFIKPPHFLPDPEARRVEECSPSQALWDPVACHELEPPRPASPPRSTQLTSQGRGQLGGGECAAPTPSGTPNGNGGHVPIPWRSLADDIRDAYPSDPVFSKRAYTKGLRRQHGLWYVQNKVVVPNSPLLKRRIMELCHDARLSGHVGITRTLDLVSRDFYWQKLRRDVEDYVRHCDACQRHKVSTKLYAGKLQPLSVPGRRWESVSMDLIVKLPTTAAGHDSILVFVDRLSKMVHFVPTVEALNAQDFAVLFVANVVKLHGLPRTLISDRGPQFNNKFWEKVCEILGMDKRMSSAYHPHTDGQTERTNRTLEEMLRSYVGYEQNDWDSKLACAEFAINNSWQESVKNTPFFLNYGQHPLTPAKLELPEDVPAASHYAEGIVENVKKAKACMEAAQQRMKARADTRRREVSYRPGDMVLLSTKNISQPGPGVKKLKPLFMGPFEVISTVGKAAVKLRLPQQWKRVHNVFHVSLVKPYIGDAQRFAPPPPPVQWLDGEPLYTVESLLDHMIVRKGRGKIYKFLVKWQGYGEEHNTWEPESNLIGCGEEVREYKALKDLPTRPLR